MKGGDDEERQLRSVARQNADSIFLARQRAERRNEFYLNEGQRLAHLGSWALNPSGVFEYWSKELLRICGLDSADAAPSRDAYLSLVHLEDRAVVARTLERMLAERSGCDVKQRIVRPDGELRYIRLVGFPMIADGRLESIVGIAMDVTEHERMTQELRRREAYLVGAQRLSHTGSFGWTIPSASMTWSDEMLRIFEYDSTAAPSVELLLGRVHPDDRALMQQVLDKAASAGTNFDTEYRLLMPDGRVKHLHVLAHTLPDASGNVELVGAIMDVTEAKLAEAERERLGRRLLQAEKMEAVGRFAGGIAHDFNNVLAGILAYGEMLLEEAPADSPRKRHAQNVLTAATRGRSLVEQILAYSGSQRGKRAPVGIAGVVAETLELVRGSLPANIRLEADAPPSPLLVIGDATRLHQVLMNLCSNAIQAMGGGGTLRVGLKIVEFTAGQAFSHGAVERGRYVRLVVEDSGCGMEEATLARIFEPFFTTKEVGRGTGLGLSMVYAIITDLAGAIDVKSAPGRGTTFAIHLPLAAADERSGH
jgi:PAS domain S-box-containing protein